MIDDGVSSGVGGGGGCWVLGANISCWAGRFLLGVGLLCGCKKVNEFVPKVRLALFHNESLPSLRGLPWGVGCTSVGGDIDDCCVSEAVGGVKLDMIIELSTVFPA